MNNSSQRLSWILAIAAVTAPLYFVVRTWPVAPRAEAKQAARASSTVKDPAPARTAPAKLYIRAASCELESATLLDATASAWDKAAPTATLLNRTPRIYQTEPARDLAIPTLEVRALRTANQLLVRMRWSDPTRNAPEPPPRKKGEGDDPAQLYKRPTGETAAFPDAAAVMIPQGKIDSTFPSLVMGDRHAPASLYYWNASHGAEEMSASGRATPKPTGKAVPFRAVHAEGKWTLTLQMPEPADGCPLAFAIWDGQLGDRDGLKFFSIWYVLKKE
jgi:Ethylbenzene dehydrogenase